MLCLTKIYCYEIEKLTTRNRICNELSGIYKINPQDRIAQMLFVPVIIADFVEVARQTAKINDRAKFVIIGPINEQIKIWQEEVMKGDRPDNLVIGGYADNPRTAMSQINVLLSLSHFAESFGRTIAEAMASRRPVIAYDWGAVSELVQHDETGYLIPHRIS